MTITIDVPPEAEARLRDEAAQHKREIADYLREIVRERFAAPTPPAAGASHISPTLALFAQWAAEDATDDPEEIARRQREGDELLAALQENRLSLRRVDVGEREAEDKAA